MNLKEAYLTQYRICVKKNLPADMDGHYQTRIEFGGKPVYVNPDGSDVVRYVFPLTGCVKKRPIKKDGVFKVITFHKDKLPVFGKVCNKRVKAFIYKYLLFLKCDGIEYPELMRLYALHLLINHLEYYTLDKSRKKHKWKKYIPEYKNVGNLLDKLIESALKKEIDESTRTQFRKVTKCVVNPVSVAKYGGRIKKNRTQFRKDGKIGQGLATDNRIREAYDPGLTDKELADKVGLSIRRIQEWKSSHKDELETKEARVIRMYDPAKSEVENAKLIGVSRNTIRKYKDKVKPVEPVKEVDTVKPVDQLDDDKWIEEAIDEWEWTH